MLDFNDQLVLIIHVLNDALTLDDTEILLCLGNESLDARRVELKFVGTKVLLDASEDVFAEVVVLPRTRGLEKCAIKAQDSASRRY